MKKISLYLLIFIFTAFCTSSKIKRSEIKLYYGTLPPESTISIVDYTPDWVEFQIRVKFKIKKLYHIIADNENNFVSEGWYRTSVNSSGIYNVKMRVKKGFKFQPGKKYCLCIGSQNPELTYVFSSKYRCIIYYEFTLPYKNCLKIRREV
ncbi:hypothetical protein NLC82_01750 [Candidatus Aminicenantes bacterium AC-335-A11]|jgi:hypothetical protein|nr:hypothetical protein [SCandidatus Aminicenantes bacterium Aminicenantia_JdfR_composite]MCP2596294.1 hypothetical protein [Candidatus Aminicenantes bacterium AC-335-G13]MCP2597869.1 hypothetical protein [Candidatus Aminicenantes bacterium AC-335-L06]MCP2618129.1 hypothetical protein [Candidatus Aminicenantes bacterium AC-335-A11]MCP2620474.1 hypothetical protein [Candidatus Aminicenantes bacterium AC-334-E05]